MDGSIRQVNLAFTKILGFVAEEVEEQPYIGFVHPDEVPHTVEALAWIIHETSKKG